MCLYCECFWIRVRGRMRFWGKSKYGDKKTSREKLICGAESIDGDYGESGPLLGDGEMSFCSLFLFFCLFHFIFVITKCLWFMQLARKTCRLPAVLTWLWTEASGTWRRTRRRPRRWSTGGAWRSAAWLWSPLSGRTTRCRSSPASTTTGAWMISS